MACIGSLRPDRQYITADQVIYISGAHLVRKECKAYFYRHGQIDLILPFFRFLFYGNLHGYNGGKVIQGPPAEDLETNVYRGFGMKICGSDGMLQVAERSFLALYKLSHKASYANSALIRTFLTI